MRAILLSAGYGKRLLPLTKKIPKCLIKINRKPLLQIWIEKLLQVGVTSILINTHYKSNQVKKFIAKSKFKKNIKLVYEKKLLGTAGTLIKNYKFVKNKDFFLIHSDNFTNDNLKKFLLAHKKRPKKTKITMMTFTTNIPENCGIVKIDKNKIVQKFYEKKKKIKLKSANGAVYILSNESIKEIKNKKFQDFSNEVIPKFLGRIFTYHTKNFFLDAGIKKNLKKIKKFNYNVKRI